MASELNFDKELAQEIVDYKGEYSEEGSAARKLLEWRITQLQIRRGTYVRMLTDSDETHLYNIQALKMEIRVGEAKKLFDAYERSLNSEIRDANLDDDRWREDWKKLISGEILLPEQGEDICSDGHKMGSRSKLHYLCPICGEVKWRQPL